MMGQGRHREMVPPGQAVNQQFHLNVLKQLLESLQRKVQKSGRVGIGSYTMTMPLPTQP